MSFIEQNFNIALIDIRYRNARFDRNDNTLLWFNNGFMKFLVLYII